MYLFVLLLFFFFFFGLPMMGRGIGAGPVGSREVLENMQVNGLELEE